MNQENNGNIEIESLSSDSEYEYDSDSGSESDDFGGAIASAFDTVVEGASSASSTVSDYSVYFFYSAINITLWFFDKLILGPPILRQYIEAGLLPQHVKETDDVRNWSILNSGCDIYQGDDDDILDNIVGVLTLPVFLVYTILNHAFASVYHNIRAYWSFSGVPSAENPEAIPENDEEPKRVTDPRNLYMRVVWGILTFPAWFIPVALTNFFIGSYYSLNYNIPHYVDWIARKDEDDELLNAYENRDERNRIVRYGFGALMLVPLIIILFFTNLYHAYANSCDYLLNYYIDWGLREVEDETEYEDERSTFKQLLSGFVSFPIWLPILFVSNFFYGSRKSLRHMLKEWGTWAIEEEMDEEHYDTDRRSTAKRYLFNVLSIELWLPLIAISNSIASIFIGTQRNIERWWEWSFTDIENEEGEFQGLSRVRYVDNLGLRRFISGLISSPIWVPIVLVSNLIGGTLCSFYRNVSSLYNLAVVMSPTLEPGEELLVNDDCDNRIFKDDRPLLAKILFGIISLPLVLPIIIPTNVIVGSLVSIYYNLVSGWNWASKYQDERIIYQDRRHWAWRVSCGVFSALIWLPIITISNLVIGVYFAIVNCTRNNFNLMGKDGMFHERLLDDENAVPLRGSFFFSCVSAIVWVPVVAVTNLFDFAFSILIKYKARTAAVLVTAITYPISFYLHSGPMKIYKAFSRDANYNPKNIGALIQYGPDNHFYKTFFWGLAGTCTFGVVPMVRQIVLRLTGYKMWKRFNTNIADLLRLRPHLAGDIEAPYYPSDDEEIDESLISESMVSESSVVDSSEQVELDHKSQEGAEKSSESNENNDADPEEVLNSFQRIQGHFKNEIENAKNGTSTVEKDWLGVTRPLFRSVGYRHPLESVLKTYHNAYLEYAKQVYNKKINSSYEYNDFKNHRIFKAAKVHAKTYVNDNVDSTLVSDVERRLNNVASPAA